jgi:DNA-directed RNA polymerase subunit RPC12/RpoP
VSDKEADFEALKAAIYEFLEYAETVERADFSNATDFGVFVERCSDLRIEMQKTNGFRCPQCGKDVPRVVLRTPGKYACALCSAEYDVPPDGAAREILGLPPVKSYFK